MDHVVFRIYLKILVWGSDIKLTVIRKTYIDENKKSKGALQ